MFTRILAVTVLAAMPAMGLGRPDDLGKRHRGALYERSGV